MLASWSYNHACLMWQVWLLVKYNIKAKSVCMCVSLPVKKLILIYLRHTCQYLTLTYTTSICPRKDLQGHKLTLTYLPGQLIREYIQYFCGILDNSIVRPDCICCHLPSHINIFLDNVSIWQSIKILVFSVWM